MHTRIHQYIRTHTYTNTYVHTQTHTHTHTHTHTQTHQPVTTGNALVDKSPVDVDELGWIFYLIFLDR